MKIVGYKTINKVNNNYYYGVRTLRKNNDSYLGSGLRIKLAIKKYGKENFERIDLKEFLTFEEALQWEKEIITPEMIKNKKCYNLKAGGVGGSLPWSEERKKEVKEKGNYKKNEEIRKKMSKAAIKRFEKEPGTFKNKKHTEETKKILSIQRIGIPSFNKGKKIKVSPERLKELKKPRTEEMKERISNTLCLLNKEQIKYLETQYIDRWGERTKLGKEWGVRMDVLTRALKKIKNRKK